MPLRLLVCGGRNFDDYPHVERVLDELHQKVAITCIIQGGAKGADALARLWATQRGVDCETYEADWDNLSAPGAIVKVYEGKMYNARAGFDRNQRMIADGKPNACLAFAGNNGTKDMIDRCRRANIKVRVET